MKQKVYISAYLKHDSHKGEKYGYGVYKELKKLFGDDLLEIQNHKKNVWCRDYMPVKASNGKFVQFKYAPSYMTGSEKWKKRIPIAKDIHKEGNINLQCESSNIKLDGGAIDVFGKKAIVSDRVFRDNTKLSEEKILKEIKTKLNLEQIIVVPQYPYDFTGHVDGLVRFINEKEVVVGDLQYELNEAKKDKNSYRKKLIENWVYAFKSALWNADIKMYELPNAIPKKYSNTSAEGVYTNFLILNDLIVMPSYNKPKKDKEAAEILQNLYKRSVKTIYATELSKQGGMINCVTWTK